MIFYQNNSDCLIHIAYLDTVLPYPNQLCIPSFSDNYKDFIDLSIQADSTQNTALFCPIYIVSPIYQAGNL